MLPYFAITEKPGYSPLNEHLVARLAKKKTAIFCYLIDEITERVFASAENLRLVAQCAVGYDNIDVGAAGRHNVKVTNTPGVLTEATADAAWALIMAVTRHIVPADRFVRRGQFQGWRPNLFLGTGIQEKTLGIVGLGRIGLALACRAKTFGMKILYTATRSHPEAAQALDATYCALEVLLKYSDIISLHVPLTEHTRHLIGPREISMMKPNAYLINTARGPIVDERSLVRALKKGRLAGAGFDVYEHEPRLTPGLEKLSNVVLLPHIASATVETRLKMAHLAADNLIAYAQGRQPPNWVNRF
ncbi:MAG: D-glycerate dehydrogenase [Elusimicrobia bacterium]|nr:D-glycerate dehydrogenase [Elusimicrobiota bacterium]